MAAASEVTSGGSRLPSEARTVPPPLPPAHSPSQSSMLAEAGSLAGDGGASPADPQLRTGAGSDVGAAQAQAQAANEVLSPGGANEGSSSGSGRSLSSAPMAVPGAGAHVKGRLLKLLLAGTCCSRFLVHFLRLHTLRLQTAINGTFMHIMKHRL